MEKVRYIHSKEEPDFRVVEPYVWINPDCCTHVYVSDKCEKCGSPAKRERAS